MVTLFIAQSLDGFIAGNDDDLSWLPEDETQDYSFHAFYDSTDALVMGSGTYRALVKMGFDNPHPEKESYIVSQRLKLDKTQYPNISVIGLSELERIVAKHEHLWLVGGGMLNRYFLEKGWIDTVILTTIPVTISQGVTLFGVGDYIQANSFILKDLKSFPDGVTQATYKLKN